MLAQAIGGRGSPHGFRGAGVAAGFQTGSHAQFMAAFYGAGGVLAAALLAGVFIRVRMRGT